MILLMRRCSIHTVLPGGVRNLLADHGEKQAALFFFSLGCVSWKLAVEILKREVVPSGFSRSVKHFRIDNKPRPLAT